LLNCRHVRDEPGEIFGEPRRHNNQPQQRLTLLAEKYSCRQKTLIGFTFADVLTKLPARHLYLFCSFSFEFCAKYEALRRREFHG
jgi:hypothetical protein